MGDPLLAVTGTDLRAVRDATLARAAERSHRGAVRIERIEVGSKEHREALELREQVLRRPLGIPGISREELAAEPKAVHFACFEGERVVGTLLLVDEAEGVLRMRQVAVWPEQQARGIGALLVKTAEEYGRARGAKKLVAHARAVVVPFYTRLGYRVVGEPFVEVTLEHRLVEKLLAD